MELNKALNILTELDEATTNEEITSIHIYPKHILVIYNLDGHNQILNIKR